MIGKRLKKPFNCFGNEDNENQLSSVKKLRKNKELKVLQIIDSEYFQSVLTNAMDKNEYKDFLSVYDIEDYESMKMFLLIYGAGGVAVTKDGDIVSLFKNRKICKGNHWNKVSNDLLKVAISNGGNKLDCYDGFLADLYIEFGFIPVCKVKFNKEYAPNTWNYNKFGEPDIIFFMHNGENINEIIQNNAMYPSFQTYNTPYLTDYYECKLMRDAVIRNRKSDL